MNQELRDLYKEDIFGYLMDAETSRKNCETAIEIIGDFN